LITYLLNTLDDTQHFACQLARKITFPCVICLKGDLGTGKTAFARAFIQEKMGAPIEVPSPTFTLIQTYVSPQGPLSHLDLYRLNFPEEALELGIEEIFLEGITLIEWPERLCSLLPSKRLEITFKIAPSLEREVTLKIFNLPFIQEEEI